MDCSADRSGTDGPALVWDEGGAVHIDVRGLEPPNPLVQILTLVMRVPEGTHVVVHHDRDPQLLYAELAEIGWQAVHVDGEPGEVRLELSRIG
jgi:hypothetical protein